MQIARYNIYYAYHDCGLQQNVLSMYTYCIYVLMFTYYIVSFTIVRLCAPIIYVNQIDGGDENNK